MHPQHPSSFNLPSFDQFLAMNQLSVNETIRLDWNILEETSQSSSSSSNHSDAQRNEFIQVSKLVQKIDDLERKLFLQDQLISNLLKEKEFLKAQTIEKRKIEKPIKCKKKAHQPVNRVKPFETSCIESEIEKGNEIQSLNKNQ